MRGQVAIFRNISREKERESIILEKYEFWKRIFGEILLPCFKIETVTFVRHARSVSVEQRDKLLESFSFLAIWACPQNMPKS
jgi:hypothetical protein